MYVKSNMTKFRKTSWSVASGEELAKKCLDSVGNYFLPNEFSPIYSHSIIQFLLYLLPSFIRDKITISTMEGVQKKLKEKLEKKN